MLKLINGAEKTRDDLMSTNIFFRLHSTTQTLTTHAYSHPYEYTSAEEEVLRKEGHSRAGKESSESCGLRSSKCPACGGSGPSLPPAALYR